MQAQFVDDVAPLSANFCGKHATPRPITTGVCNTVDMININFNSLSISERFRTQRRANAKITNIVMIPTNIPELEINTGKNNPDMS
jgi:hypothetical protein